MVDAAKGRHVDGLTSDGTGTTDTGGVLAGSGVDDGIHDDLEGVLKENWENYKNNPYLRLENE